jgi:hypothetical protein
MYLYIDKRFYINEKTFCVDKSALFLDTEKTIPRQVFLINSETGCGAEFYLYRIFGHTIFLDSLDNVYYWLYRPTPEAIKCFPNLKGWTLRIYNS